RLAGAYDALKRPAQVARARGLRVVGVVREDVEDPAAGDLLALGQRRSQVRVGDRDDAQFRVQHQQWDRRVLKERAEVHGTPNRRQRARRVVGLTTRVDRVWSDPEQFAWLVG